MAKDSTPNAVCVQCGKNYWVCSSRLPTTRFCSQACKGLSMRGAIRRTPQERFWEKVEKAGLWDCWEWKGGQRGGYGRFGMEKGYLVEAHRLAYEWANGPIPEGKVLDHLCLNPSCVNPVHLEVVTRRENTRRGSTGKYMEPREKGFCYRGHPLDTDVPHCRVCHKENERRRKEKDPEGYREKKNLSAQRSREKDREKYRERDREYREKDPEGYNAAKRKYREENPERFREYRQRFKEKNPEYHREKAREYRKQNPERYREIKQRYREKKRASALTVPP